jgi:hypothetical protein
MKKYGKSIRKTYKKINWKIKNNKNKSRKQKQRGAGIKIADLNKVKIMYFARGKKGDEKPGEFVVVNENGEQNADIFIRNGYPSKENIETKPQSIFSKLTKDILSVESLIENIKDGYTQDVKQYPTIVETITMSSNQPNKDIEKNIKIQNNKNPK